MADIGVVELILRPIAAALLGGLVGIEREADGHEAGFRTHMLIALGAGLLGLISVGAFDMFAAPRSETNFQVDVTRVASYVGAGVGFIGAGAILKRGGGIHGLTTAASLWAVAAIGLAAGLGFWVPALTATATAIVTLAVLKPLRKLVQRRSTPATTAVVLRLEPGAKAAPVLEWIETAPDLHPVSTELTQVRTGDTRHVEVRLKLATSDADAARARLAALVDDRLVASVETE
jgi:putative Mg2+ transporter-C (MgtC) family protein